MSFTDKLMLAALWLAFLTCNGILSVSIMATNERIRALESEMQKLRQPECSPPSQ